MTAATGSALTPAIPANPVRLRSLGVTFALLSNLVTAPGHAGAVRLIVALQARLLRSLGLLSGLLVRRVLAHPSTNGTDTGPDGGSLPGIAPDGPADGAHRGAARGAAGGPALLWRRRHRRRRLRGI